MKNNLMAAMACILLLGTSVRLHAEVWNKLAAGSYDFNTAVNWTPNTVPNAAEAEADMFENLSGGAAINVDLSSDVTIGWLVLGDTGGYNGWIDLDSATSKKLIMDNNGVAQAPGFVGARITGLHGKGGTPSFNGNFVRCGIELQDNLNIEASSGRIVFIDGGITESGGNYELTLGRAGGNAYNGQVILKSALRHTGGITLVGATTFRLDDGADLGTNIVTHGSWGGTLQLFSATECTIRGLAAAGNFSAYVVTSASGLSGARTLHIETQAGDDYTYGGRLYGDADSLLILDKSGDGIQRLGGGQAYGSLGTWTVSGGTLSLEKTANLNQVSDVVVDGGTLRWGAAQQVADTANITMNSGALEVLSGGVLTEILGSVTINGGAIANDGQFNVMATSGDALTMKGGVGLCCKFALAAGGAQSTHFDASGSGIATISGLGLTFVGPDSGTSVKTFNIEDGDAGVDMIITAPITQFGTGTAVTLRKTGAGRLQLSGSCGYVGATRIEAGSIQLGGDDRIDDTSDLVLDGGTFETDGQSDTLDLLQLVSSSTIDMGDGSSVLHFSDSSAVAWGGILTITNWSGDVAGGGADQIYVGTAAGHLNAAQLGSIQFSGNPTLGAEQLATGEIVPASEDPGDPDISAAPALLNFGTINPFATSNLSVVVSNAGPGLLIITNFTYSGSNTFSVLESTPINVASGAVSVLTVEYDPAGSSGTDTGTLHIASNDPDTSPTNIILQAQAALPPGLFNGSFDYDADEINGIDGQAWGQVFTSLSGWTYSGSGSLRLANGDSAGPPYYTGNGGTMPNRYPTDGETYLSLGDCDYNLTQVISGMSIGRVNVSFDLLNMQHNPTHASIQARVELFDGNSDAAPLLYDSGTINIHNLPEETWTPYASGDLENTSSILFIRVTLFENADASAGGIDNIVVSQVPFTNISASPSLLDFGTMESGAISNLSVVVSNAGPGTLSITDFTFSGSNTFSVLESTPIGVASGATTTVTVKYQPAGDIATHTGTLHIASNDPDTNPTNIILQAASFAVPLDISVTPSSLAFGTVNPYATSNLSVVVSNAGPGILSVTDLTCSGSSTFSVLGSTTPFSVTVGAVSNLRVQYNPAGSSGTHTGTLHIASNDPDTSPTNITLQGQAVLPPGLFNGSFDYDADAINGIAGQAWGQVFTSLSGWTYSGSGNLRLANGNADGPPYYTGNGSSMPFRYPTDGETYLSLGECDYNLTQVISGMRIGLVNVSFDLLNMQHNPVHAAIRARVELFDGNSDAAPLLYDSGMINIHNMPEETWTSYASGDLENTSTVLFIRVTLFENADAAAGGIDNIALTFTPVEPDGLLIIVR